MAATKKKPVYDVKYSKDLKLSFSDGNQKLGKGVWNINLLPGDEPLEVKSKCPLTSEPGTCQGVCDGCKGACYAISLDKFRHTTCIPSQLKNTVIMRKDLDGYFQQIKDFCKKPKVKYFRYHSFGEIESYDYLLKMVETANECSDVTFYVYTKRFDFVSQYLKENKSFPENLVVNISEWHGNTKGYDFKGLNTFIYDDHTDPALKKVTHCPAVDAKGKETGVKCIDCKRCMKAGHKTAVYAH